MGFGQGVANSSARSLIPLGLIQHRTEKDNWNNDVSIIILTDGTKFRMVHHTPPHYSKQRATIYAGRGKFVKVATNSPENDCMAHTCEIAGYKVEWGDGDNLGAQQPPEEEGKPLPFLKNILGEIPDDDFDTVIINVLVRIQHVAHAWQYKEVLKKG